jgi:FkbM family methyltransferase
VSLKSEQNEIEAMLGVAEAIVAKRPTSIDMTERLVAWVVPTAAGAPVVDGFVRYAYEDLFVSGLNRHETTFLCREVFERSAYLRHGLSLPEGACVFDVGANIGIFSLQAHLCSPGARIFAFEPNPDAYRCLLANVRIFGLSGEFLCVGLGGNTGQAEFTAYDGFSLLSGFHADREADFAVIREYLRHLPSQTDAGETELLEDLLKNRLEARRTKRPVTTISDVIRQHAIDAIDFLKINVEKSEGKVLEGVRHEDWTKIRQVALEVHDVNGRLNDIVDLLERHGFSVTTEKDWSLPGAESVNYYVYASRGGGRRQPAPAVRRSNTPALLTPPGIKRALAARLPDYEVPERVLVLECMPLNDHGKVDQAALDALLAQPDTSGRPEPPRTRLEAQLLTEWQENLGRDDVGVETNFLDDGGDSFSIMRLNLRIRRLLGVDVPVVEMFRHSSIRQLADVLGCEATERDVAGIV